ncbi:MAG TPA: class I SAM-dependent methyltransferase, partial [Pyrinomonadaceae bacterium]|nr:class I SAM-dependent methyltransferase [Pyrinomonadaceae bacterium]
MTDARFESGAPDYAAYLQTAEGRLRLDIAWENFRAAITEANAARPASGTHAAPPHAAQAKPASEPEKHAGAHGARRALDLGGGTGAIALRFAALGWHASIVDPSASMLALAADAARAETFEARVTFHQSTAENAHQLFAPRTFDAAACHNVLEYVSDPRACVRALAALVKPGGLVSLVARNRAGEAMRAALKAHDLDEAERALTV